MLMNNNAIDTAISKARYQYKKAGQSPEALARERENTRKWKADHPEKQREYEQRFYLRKAVEYGLVKPEEVEELDSETLYKAIYAYRKEKEYV